MIDTGNGKLEEGESFPNFMLVGSHSVWEQFVFSTVSSWIYDRLLTTLSTVYASDILYH